MNHSLIPPKAEAPTGSTAHLPAGSGQQGKQKNAPDVGAVRRRLRYIARAIYYAAVHRGFKHVRWALAAEGVQW